MSISKKIITTLIILAVALAGLIIWGVFWGYDWISGFVIADILTGLTLIVFIWMSKKVIKGTVLQIAVYKPGSKELSKTLNDEDMIQLVELIVEEEPACMDLQTIVSYEEIMVDIHTDNKIRTLKFCYNDEDEFLIKFGKCYYIEGLSPEKTELILTLLRKYS